MFDHTKIKTIAKTDRFVQTETVAKTDRFVQTDLSFRDNFGFKPPAIKAPEPSINVPLQVGGKFMQAMRSPEKRELKSTEECARGWYGAQGTTGSSNGQARTRSIDRRKKKSTSTEGKKVDKQLVVETKQKES